MASRSYLRFAVYSRTWRKLNPLMFPIRTFTNNVHLTSLFIIMLLTLISANNKTHGTFDHARTYCSKHGGLWYNDSVTTSLFKRYKVNDCYIRNKLGLNDGEAVWIDLQAELGTYITQQGCATSLPQGFIIHLTEKVSIFQCTKECFARGSMNYISVHNDQCYCMTDDHSDVKCSGSRLAVVYRKFQYNVREGTHRCIIAEVDNYQLSYTSSKCSDKYRGVCVDDSPESKLLDNCTTYHNTSAKIGRDFCMPLGAYNIFELNDKCSEYNGKLTPHLYQSINLYLDDGFYFQDSFITFEPQTPGDHFVKEDSISCLSITKQGCMLIFETDKCDNVNRYVCNDNFQIKQTGAAIRMVSVKVFIYFILHCHLF